MSTTLYRKYRPQTFAEIVNQEHVKGTIQQEIKSGKMPHAFLFCGPRGTGKTTTARVIAKALNCKKRKDGEAEPCNTCDACDAVNNSSSLSLVEVDAASQTGVDNVRDNIIANARVAVKSDEYKVFIIDEVHMLSSSSFNALLKTLEEPPAKVVFILATTELHKIPETILSRCQRFDFHPIKATLLQPYLADIVKREKRKVDDEVLAAIVKKSGGYVRDAMSLLGQVLTLPGTIDAQAASLILPVPHKEHIVALAHLIARRETKAAFDYVGELEKQGVRMAPFAQELIDFMHAVMLACAGSHVEVVLEGVADAQRETVQSIVAAFTPASSMAALDVLMRRYQQLKSYDQGIIPFELAMVELCERGAATIAPATPASAPASMSRVSSSVTSTPPATPLLQSSAKPAVSPSQSSAKPSIKKTVTRATVASAVSEAPAQAATMAEAGGPAATYDEVQPVWQRILHDVSEAQHSMFIVLRTAVLRQGKAGDPELAFRYRMHHDHVKRSQAVLSQQAAKHLPNKQIRFTLSIDENLDSAMAGDVEEPKQAETAALGAELSRLAEAFGGSVME